MFNEQRCCEECIAAEKELRGYDRIRDEVMRELLGGI
jgi:hypothetical protein